MPAQDASIPTGNVAQGHGAPGVVGACRFGAQGDGEAAIACSFGSCIVDLPDVGPRFCSQRGRQALYMNGSVKDQMPQVVRLADCAAPVLAHHCSVANFWRRKGTRTRASGTEFGVAPTGLVSWSPSLTFAACRMYSEDAEGIESNPEPPASPKPNADPAYRSISS